MGVAPPPSPLSHGDGGYEGDTVALTYRELADRLGVGVEAAKARARRGGWARVPGNDGAMRVHVPVEALRAVGTTPDAPARSDVVSETMRVVLEAQADAHRGELVRVAQAHARELARLRDAHAAELGKAEARAERAAAQEVVAREQLAVALAEVERLRQASRPLDRLRRSLLWAKLSLCPSRRIAKAMALPLQYPRGRLAEAKRLLRFVGRNPFRLG